jgi:hypothetical protein
VCIAQPTDQRHGQAGPGAVTADRDVCSRNTLVPQKTPYRQRVVVRCRERMFGREPIGNGQRAYSRSSTSLGHQATMTKDRTRTIAATMKKQKNTRGIAARNDRPFSRYAVRISRGKFHILGDGPDRTNFIQAPSSRRPSARSRLGTQQRTDRVDFALNHAVSDWYYSQSMNFRLLSARRPCHSARSNGK